MSGNVGELACSGSLSKRRERTTARKRPWNCTREKRKNFSTKKEAPRDTHIRHEKCACFGKGLILRKDEVGPEGGSCRATREEDSKSKGGRGTRAAAAGELRKATEKRRR